MLFPIIKGLSDLEDENIIYDSCIILMDFFLLDSFILQLYFRCNGWVVIFCLLANYNDKTFTINRVGYHAFSDYMNCFDLEDKNILFD